MTNMNDDENDPSNRRTQWDILQDLVTVNKSYFLTHQDQSGLRITAALNAIVDLLEELRPLYNEITEIAPQYDFDEKTKGNGYRSFLYLVDRCIKHTTDICQQIADGRDSVLFRKSNYMREIEACSQLVASLTTFLHHLKTLNSWSELGTDNRPSLFPSEEHSPQELLSQAGNIDQYVFYGRCIGFQFYDLLRNLLKGVVVAMAAYSEMYFKNGSLLGRCFNSMKYLIDPEARARRIVNISQRADVHFCKAFWSFHDTKFIQFVPYMMTPSLAIDQVISIPPEDLSLPSTLNNSLVQIPIPSSHIGKKPIHVKLYSSKRRIGMVGSASASGELHDPCETLLFHCHGGGFVADSPKCHESYLRHWIVNLDVPMLSIDYSLSPEAPYPRALEEIVYTYAWALKHANSLLGTTANKIILVGDSAGANLNLGLTAKCIEMNIRKPDGIFMAYCPVLVEFVPSPARMLGLTDALLPFGFMMRCLQAYTLGDINHKENFNEIETQFSESFAEVSESDLIALALSPNDDEAEDNQLASLPSDSTLNSVSLADADPQDPETLANQGPESHEDQSETTSQEYIRKFLNLYKNVSFKKPQVNNNGDIEPIDGAGSSFFRLPFGRTGNGVRELDTDCAKDPSEEFIFEVPKDPFLSPYRHKDEILKQFPTCRILTSDLDPCLDDSVMFARKLKALGNNVSLDIVHALPHGFLNFRALSKECTEAAEFCQKRIKELIDL